MTDKTDALRARELLAAEYAKRGMGVDFVNDAGTPTAIALAAIREALAAPAEGGQGEAVELTKCCGLEECGGECGNEWRGTEWVRKAAQPAASVDVDALKGIASNLNDIAVGLFNVHRIRAQQVSGLAAQLSWLIDSAGTKAASVDVDRLLSVLPPEVRSMNGYDAAWAAGFNEGVSQARENISRALIDSAGGVKVYQCPRCSTSMEVDPTAKPAPQPAEGDGAVA